MSRSFSLSLSCCSNVKVKAVSALITNKISHAIIARTRRGYAYAYAYAYAASASPSASASRGQLSASMARVGAPNVVLKKGSSASWVPDPKTGYYRPENHAKDDHLVLDAKQQDRKGN